MFSHDVSTFNLQRRAFSINPVRNQPVALKHVGRRHHHKATYSLPDIQRKKNVLSHEYPVAEIQLTTLETNGQIYLILPALMVLTKINFDDSLSTF